MAVLAAAMGLTVTLREARASSPTPQLPDLVADPPDNISLAQSEETPAHEHMKAELLLRFNGYLHNKGPGALDFRGMRSAPTSPSEPASPPMGVFQRIYEYPSAEGPPPTAETTPHKDDPSNGIMEYVTADGHEHWHLQHVAKYSLWNATKTAEVAPSQKVGFCLEDSEHIEYWKGPEEQIYKEGGEHPREFCRYRQPAATEVFEGISEGWRDVYTSNLAFQWVDVSDVEPGEYFLRAEADPEHFIQETPEEKPAAYAEKPTVVPGFDASTQVVDVNIDHTLTVKLTSEKWEGPEQDEQPSNNPVYEIVTPPAHGTLGPIEGDQIQYTPAAGYSGPDSFTFAARDPHSAFPQSPAVASVSLDVGDHPPSVAIEGAPTSMIAGTSVSLSALVQNDADEVKWSSSFPTIASTGPETATYTAPSTPPPGGFVTVTAESPDWRSRPAYDRNQAIRRPRAQTGSATRATAPTPGKSAGTSVGPLSKPTAMLIGRKLYMTATAERAGRLRLTAIVRGRRVGSCLAQVKRRQAFTCTTTLPKSVSTKAPIGVWATLRVGNRLIQTVRHPARVPSAMKAMAAASWRGIQAAWRYLCGG